VNNKEINDKLKPIAQKAKVLKIIYDAELNAWKNKP